MAWRHTDLIASPSLVGGIVPGQWRTADQPLGRQGRGHGHTQGTPFFSTLDRSPKILRMRPLYFSYSFGVYHVDREGHHDACGGASDEERKLVQLCHGQFGGPMGRAVHQRAQNGPRGEQGGKQGEDGEAITGGAHDARAAVLPRPKEAPPFVFL